MISGIYSTNQSHTSFGSGLKIINGNVNKLPGDTIKYLEEEFPRATEALPGNMTLTLSDVKMSEFRHRFSEGISIIEGKINTSEPKDQLLGRLVNLANGILARYNVYKKMEPIKGDIFRLKLDLEVKQLPDYIEINTDEYKQMIALQEKLSSLETEDRKGYEQIVNALGIKNINTSILNRFGKF